MGLGEEDMTSKFRWFWNNPDKGYVFWQFMLIAAITASCGFNGAHAALASIEAQQSVGRVIAAVFGAMIPPLFFFAIAEGVLLIWHRELPRLGTALLGMLVLVAGSAAGVRSFFGLVDFSDRFDTLPADHRAWLVYMLPLVTDALALASTLALFILKDAPARKRKAKPQRKESDIATIGLFPRWRIRLFGGAAKVPELSETPQVKHAESVREPVMNTADDVHEAFPEASANDFREVHEPVRESVTKTAAKRQPKVREPAPNPELEPFIPAAKWMLETRAVTRKSETEVAAIIKLVNDGLNSYEIRKQVGGSTDTADKVSRAWRQWQEQQRDGQHEWQLTAVG